MADTIPILWPTGIEVEVQSPYAILQTQIAPLSKMTKGLLRAELTRDAIEGEGESQIAFTLDLVAPPLHNYRHQILRVWHTQDLPYPVWIEAACFEHEDRLFFDGELLSSEVSRVVQVATPDEFIEKLGEALNSKEVKTILFSLLARITDESAALRK